jgi:hypothetical protein
MRQGWYSKQVRRVHRAFANDFDNQARLARYQRRDGLQVDTATGEIVGPAPGGVREKVLAFAFGEKKPAGAGSRAENYGRRAAAPISGYIKSLPKGRTAKRVFGAVAIVVFALLLWRGITYTVPELQAAEAVRTAGIERQNNYVEWLHSLSDEEQEQQKWQEYYESFD